MKRIIPILFILIACFFISLQVKAQVPNDFTCHHFNDVDTDHDQPPAQGAVISSTNGRILTPKGTLRFLVVFAGFEGFEGNEEALDNGTEPVLGGWSNDISPDFQLPNWVENQNGNIRTTEVFFNEESDFAPGGPIDDPEIENATKILNLMSKPNEDFKFMGSVFSDENEEPIMVTLDPATITGTGWQAMNRQVANRMINDIRPVTNPDGSPNQSNIDYWAQFNQRENFSGYCIDNSDTNANPPDDILDFVIYIWRYNPNWRLNGVPVQPIPGMQFWQGSTGAFYSDLVTGSNNLINGIGFHHGFCIPTGASANDPGLFLHEFAHGLFDSPHVGGANNVFGDYLTLPTMSVGTTTGLLKPFRHLMAAWERWYLGFIDPIDVTSDQTVIIRDFIETGDAIRVIIPNSANSLDPDAVDQRLWIENHTGKNGLDTHRWKGRTISNVELTDSDNGLYMYVENIAENHTITDVLDDGANGVKMINPMGNWDARLNFSEGVTTNSWGHRMLQYETLEENPIAGGNPWFWHQHDYKGDGNGGPNDRIFYNDHWNGTNVGGGAEGEKVKRERISDVDTYTYRNFGINGNQHSTAFVAGDVLAMGTNPTIINHPTFDVPNDRVTPYVLNGLKVEVLSINEETGEAEVSIKFKETEIDNDVRWTGDIVLPDITENNDADLVLAEDKIITLDLSKIVNRTISPPGENDFVNPTTFTIASDAKIHLRDRARIIVKNGSTLIIEDGAEVLLDQHACIVVEPTGTLIINGNNIRLGGSESVIVLKGKLKTDDDVDFTFTGPGYIDIHPSHQVNMGENSNFVIERPIVQNKQRVIRVREDTDFQLSECELRLYSVKVELDINADITMTDGSVDAHATVFNCVGGNNNTNTALRISDGTKCIVKYCEFYRNKTAINIDGFGSSQSGMLVPTIWNSHFEGNGIGIIAQGLGTPDPDLPAMNTMISLRGNHFTRTRSHAIELTNIDVAFTDENLIDGFLSIEPDQFRFTENGIILNNVNTAYVSSQSYIKGCTENGIKATHSNVFVRNGTWIDDNGTGVLFEGNTTDEYMLSVGACDCAYITNNDIGMAGDNMVLSIDAIENQNICNNDTPRPNDFSGNTLTFDICYTDPTFPINVPILMRSNYWGAIPPSQPPTSYSIKHTSCVFTFNNVPIDDSDWTTSVSQFCGIVQIQPPAPYPSLPKFPVKVADKIDCEVNQLGTVYEVDEQSRWAFADFYVEDYSTALTRFQPVANLDRGTYNASTCVHKINFARCIVQAIENSQGATGYSENWYEGAEKALREGAGPVLISPNPATNHLQLLSPADQQYQLQVYDLMSRVLYSDSFNGNYDMNISNWESGLYFFSIQNEKGERVQTTKVSVQ